MIRSNSFQDNRLNFSHSGPNQKCCIRKVWFKRKFGIRFSNRKYLGPKWPARAKFFDFSWESNFLFSKPTGCGSLLRVPIDIFQLVKYIWFPDNAFSSLQLKPEGLNKTETEFWSDLSWYSNSVSLKAATARMFFVNVSVHIVVFVHDDSLPITFFNSFFQNLKRLSCQKFCKSMALHCIRTILFHTYRLLFFITMSIEKFQVSNSFKKRNFKFYCSQRELDCLWIPNLHIHMNLFEIPTHVSPKLPTGLLPSRSPWTVLSV